MVLQKGLRVKLCKGLKIKGAPPLSFNYKFLQVLISCSRFLLKVETTAHVFFKFINLLCGSFSKAHKHVTAFHLAMIFIANKFRFESRQIHSAHQWQVIFASVSAHLHCAAVW